MQNPILRPKEQTKKNMKTATKAHQVAKEAAEQASKAKTEFIANKLKIKSMRYETESCILCEASASLFSRKIKNYKILELTEEIKKLKKFKKNGIYKFPRKLSEFSELINTNNKNRFNCVILPMEAFLKAFKINL